MPSVKAMKSSFKQRERSSTFLELGKTRKDRKDLQRLENKRQVQWAAQVESPYLARRAPGETTTTTVLRGTTSAAARPQPASHCARGSREPARHVRRSGGTAGRAQQTAGRTVVSVLSQVPPIRPLPSLLP